MGGIVDLLLIWFWDFCFVFSVMMFAPYHHWLETAGLLFQDFSSILKQNNVNYSFMEVVVEMRTIFRMRNLARKNVDLKNNCL